MDEDSSQAQGQEYQQRMNGTGGRHAHRVPSLSILSFRHPMGVRTVPVLRTRADRTQ